jgi:hypothetical protein
MRAGAGQGEMCRHSVFVLFLSLSWCYAHIISSFTSFATKLQRRISYTYIATFILCWVSIRVKSSRSISGVVHPWANRKNKNKKKQKKTLTFTGKYGGTRQELEKLNSRVRRSQSPTHRDSRHRRYWWYTSKTRIFFLFYFRKYYYRPEFEATCVQVWTPTRLFYHTQNSCCITYKAKY